MNERADLVLATSLLLAAFLLVLMHAFKTRLFSRKSLKRA